MENKTAESLNYYKELTKSAASIFGVVERMDCGGTAAWHWGNWVHGLRYDFHPHFEEDSKHRKRQRAQRGYSTFFPCPSRGLQEKVETVWTRSVPLGSRRKLWLLQRHRQSNLVRG